jgi:hypothetical protein
MELAVAVMSIYSKCSTIMLIQFTLKETDFPFRNLMQISDKTAHQFKV